MADYIKLNRSELEASISRVVQAKEYYDTAIKDLGVVINSLQELWEGASQVAMYERYSSQSANFQRFSEEIGEYISGMKKTAAELPAEDMSISSAIQSLL